MENLEFFEGLKHQTINAHVHMNRVVVWLNMLFYLNHELNSNYNSVMMNYFYVLLYEATHSGKEYINSVYQNIKGSNTKNEKTFSILHHHIPLLLDDFEEDEVLYLNFRRDDACHIFTNGWEIDINFSKNKLKDTRKKQDIREIDIKIENVIRRHGGLPEKNVDSYFLKTLFNKILDLNEKLKNVI